MASLTPFMGPNSGDIPWVQQISKTLKTQLSITIDTPPVSIFEIPKTLKDEKVDAYVPQRIGMGPKHRFQTDLYQKMEQNKVVAVKKVLKPNQIIQESEDQIVEKLKESIPIITACYETYPEADLDTLAWLFAIDGLFLLDQLGAFADYKLAVDAKDLIKLENQIPLTVLKEIQKALSPENPYAKEGYLESKIQSFCEYYSPFILSENKINFSRVNHLLDYMYHSIVSNENAGGVEFKKAADFPPETDAMVELLEAAIQFGEMIPGSKPILQIVESIEKQFFANAENTEKVEEVKVPSVSELGDIAKVKFQLSPRTGGIRNIRFVQEKETERFIYLPRMTLDFNSEVILRNLVAYEQLMAMNSITGGFGLEITEYVDFLCGIIDNEEDVNLLREAKIIEGNLGDKEIVQLFNGIGRSLGKMGVESELRKTVAEINKVYGSMPSVKLQRMADKQVRAAAKAITFVASISSTLFLIREAYVKSSGSDAPQMLVNFLSQQLGPFSSLIQ